MSAFAGSTTDDVVAMDASEVIARRGHNRFEPGSLMFTAEACAQLLWYNRSIKN